MFISHYFLRVKTLRPWLKRHSTGALEGSLVLYFTKSFLIIGNAYRDFKLVSESSKYFLTSLWAGLSDAISLPNDISKTNKSSESSDLPLPSSLDETGLCCCSKATASSAFFSCHLSFQSWSNIDGKLAGLSLLSVLHDWLILNQTSLLQLLR